MNSIINNFVTLTKIPHCSKNSDQLKDFLVNFATKRSYNVDIDRFGNIHIYKDSPKICLQAHYDMVCIGTAPKIDIVIDNGWMRAKNSSLGADNGMAIAIMMQLMSDDYDIEFLFTSDEEIGLIGANGVDFELKSSYMLNLDSEDEGEICIGCAGGVDIVASKTYQKYTSNEALNFYEVSIEGLEGGHSGVDIDKNIPNAIKILASFIQKNNLLIGQFKGGERRNSIPTSAKAIVATPQKLSSEGKISVKACERVELYDSLELNSILNDFVHGVLAKNDILEVVQSSINLAIVNFKDGVATIETSARSMDGKDLKTVSKTYLDFFAHANYTTTLEEKYPSWKPYIGKFVKIVEEEMNKIFLKSSLVAIHAGLECGVLSQKYPKMEFASIGPTIRFPHSNREEVRLESVSKIYQVVLEIYERLS
ncbi:MAG: M20/M25/M40 family metallo-hydrolase [Epsilonproteobacteria bacterium]|nr:M20/M25/M40 family metallo-hydrolase [Campylobacterota bacterium]MBD3839503.1 M20/M25/M40 family metallo-hydrolase [Campylobacterota bacterium]